MLCCPSLYLLALRRHIWECMLHDDFYACMASRCIPSPLRVDLSRCSYQNTPLKPPPPPPESLCNAYLLPHATTQVFIRECPIVQARHRAATNWKHVERDIRAVYLIRLP